MGVGYSYLGVKLLLTSRECKAKIFSVVNFVTGSLRPVRSETDPNLSTWYKTHSRVYVAADHACWQDAEYAQKVRKNRFGRVVKSDVVGLNRMLRRHFGDVVGWLGGGGATAGGFGGDGAGDGETGGGA
jgi:histone deacetylase 6